MIGSALGSDIPKGTTIVLLMLLVYMQYKTKHINLYAEEKSPGYEFSNDPWPR